MEESDFKKRLNDKNSAIQDLYEIIEDKENQVNKLNDTVSYLMKRIRANDEVTSELDRILNIQKEEIERLKKKEDQYHTEAGSQQQIITQHLMSRDSLVSQLQNELISVKTRLKKYEKVD